MQIRLAKDVEAFVEEQVRIGAAPSASDLVNDTLRAMRAHPVAVSADLEAWLLEAADRPTAPLRKTDFAAIRRRVRSRLATATP